MKIKELTSTLLSIILAVSLCISFVPAWAYGDSSSNATSSEVCSHQHDESCGYQEGIEGSCKHVHDESCGYSTKTDSSLSDTDSNVANGSDGVAFDNTDVSHSVVSWEWVDEQQVLSENDGVWSVGLSVVSESDPTICDTLKDLLPSQVTATMADGEKKILDITWDLSSISEGGGRFRVITKSLHL